jgi:predicted metal-binding protein
MLKFPAPFPTAIFVCTHKRPDGHPKPCCADRGGKELREELREMVRAKGLEGQIRVFTSGCLGGCEKGIMAVKYPDGELMMSVTQDDLQQILDDATGD